MGRPSWVKSIEDFLKPLSDLINENVSFGIILAVALGFALLLFGGHQLWIYVFPANYEEKHTKKKLSKQSSKFHAISSTRSLYGIEEQSPQVVDSYEGEPGAAPIALQLAEPAGFNEKRTSYIL